MDQTMGVSDQPRRGALRHAGGRAFRGGLRAFIRSLTNRFGRRTARREAWRKWQALLSGKSCDEQLWAVRPPRGMIASPAVRDWAIRALEWAGYDPRVMLVEWEIYWRRKGQ